MHARRLRWPRRDHSN
jgi:quercetin dioxygenase-like cupin family protein